MGLVPQAFDPSRASLVYRRQLPHWRQPGAAYFITFRLADSLPVEVLRRWIADDQRWLASQPQPLTDEQQQERINRYGRKLLSHLDAGHGRCLLKFPSERKELRDSLLHFDGERYLLGEYAIMPNHVHALVMPLGSWDLTDIAASWMRYSAVRINRVAERSGKLWQGEPFDHIVRDRVAYARFTQYIRDNPEKVPSGRAERGRGKLTW